MIQIAEPFIRPDPLPFFQAVRLFLRVFQLFHLKTHVNTTTPQTLPPVKILVVS